MVLILAVFTSDKQLKNKADLPKLRGDHNYPLIGLSLPSDKVLLVNLCKKNATLQSKLVECSKRNTTHKTQHTTQHTTHITHTTHNTQHNTPHNAQHTTQHTTHHTTHTQHTTRNAQHTTHNTALCRRPQNLCSMTPLDLFASRIPPGRTIRCCIAFLGCCFCCCVCVCVCSPMLLSLLPLLSLLSLLLCISTRSMFNDSYL